ncbi:hypothetical protein [Allosphingosinicella vermicomposti]|uniref:hypothetical protein n=1 Tax=Allosphingosinicella vermicomposti TaxID=614671 RepID=UPI00131A4B0E|nr:hypothetical protein [Allosphingosinicella vermicomposti]
MSQQPFAVLYRWKIDPAHEDEFRRGWRTATIELRDNFGALGSCLSRDAAGSFFAFARWPSEEHREMALSSRIPADPAPGVLEFEQTKLWVEDDFLSR